ncbi:hypothetical protein, partial [Streptomyces montanisoli]
AGPGAVALSGAVGVCGPCVPVAAAHGVAGPSLPAVRTRPLPVERLPFPSARSNGETPVPPT